MKEKILEVKNLEVSFKTYVRQYLQKQSCDCFQNRTQ